VGNVGPIALSTYELDRIAPVAPTFASTPLSPGPDDAPEWEIDVEAGAELHCQLDGIDLGVPCPTTVSASLVDDGWHHLVVWAVDTAGNVGPTATNDYLLDRQPPSAPIVGAPATPGKERLPTWTITVEPDAVAECSFDGEPATACGSVFTSPAPLRDGPHVLLVVARDAAGNPSAPVSSTYQLDTVPPKAPVITDTPGPGAWRWRFTLEPGATAECSIDGSAWSACTSPVSGGSPGKPVRFEVRAVDRAGNRSSVASTSTTPPAAAAATPAAPAAPPPAPVALPRVVPAPGAPAVAEPARQAPAATPAPVTAPREPLVDKGDDQPVQMAPPPGRRGLDFFAGPVANLVQAAAGRTTIPGLVILTVVVFLAVQDRIDRRDPKLANAPVRQEPEYLEFK
jgi:hypothetical protein